MTVFQGIILGLIQGIAEFLPISSSGHLVVAQKLFGLEGVPLLFDIFLHLATLLAVVLYFRRIIGKLFAILFRWIFRRPEPAVSESDLQIAKVATLAPSEHGGRRTIVMIILTTLVTGVIGLCTSKLIPELPIQAVCWGFIFTALLLLGASIFDKIRCLHRSMMTGVSGEPHRAGYTRIRWFQALIIGFAQGVGTLPGVSRSGSTIAGALFSGVDRHTAGDYSFIVSIPAILGAFILELKDLGDVAGTIGAAPVIAGCAAAFVSGYLALTWLMGIIRRGHLEWFAAYLIPLGVLGLIFF